MNEQLINFIQLCLADGVISEKEREVIFRKAREFGVDEDECEILIDSYTFKVNKTSKTNKPITLKPDRKFVLKKVNKIAPASLNQEKDLYKKIEIFTEEEKIITLDYNKFFKLLSSINDNIKPISASLKVDFENLKKGLVNSREIRLRGEALFQRRIKKDMKPLVDMETALTAKESEETKRYQPKETKKFLKPIAIDFWEDDEDIVPSKEDRAQWRKFQKEKTKSKRDRHKNLPDDIV